MNQTAEHQARETTESPEKRIFEDAYEIAKNNADYKMHMSNIIKLGHEIKKHLNGHRALFSDFERESGLLEGLFVECVYRVGLEDGKRQANK